jgi:hypothetical protein
MSFTGGCHCGNIEIEFETDIEPSLIEVRACQCSFCRKHNGLAMSDPNGHAAIRIDRAELLSSYEFGLKTAIYVVCKRCGVYVAAVTREEPTCAIVILNALDDRERFTQPPRPVDYGEEDRTARIARRHRNWTPATVKIAS